MDLINIGLQVTSFTPTTTPTDVVVEPKSDTDKCIQKIILPICGSFICSAYVTPVGTHLIFPKVSYSLASGTYMLGNGCAQASTIAACAACRVISSSTSRHADEMAGFPEEEPTSPQANEMERLSDEELNFRGIFRNPDPIAWSAAVGASGSSCSGILVHLMAQQFLPLTPIDPMAPYLIAGQAVSLPAIYLCFVGKCPPCPGSANTN